MIRVKVLAGKARKESTIPDPGGSTTKEETTPLAPREAEGKSNEVLYYILLKSLEVVG